MIIFPMTSLDASHNFAAEYYIMATMKPTAPVLLLWSTSPTVMLGKYQDAGSEINWPFVSSHHIKVVRRLSGGGTIYTDQGGCQFTLITPDESQVIDFENGLSLITQALNKIGIQATTDSRNDLIVAGLKVSGSAQYLMPGYRLHHGSLLFNADLKALTQSLQVDPLKLKAKHIHSVHQRTINLNDQQPTWTMSEFKDRLQTALMTLTKSTTAHFTNADETNITAIAHQLFAEVERPTQPITFDYQKKAYYTGVGLLKVSYNLDTRNRFSDIKLTGDFFSNLDAKQFEQALLGTAHQPERIRPLVQQILTQSPIKGLMPDQLISLLF